MGEQEQKCSFFEYIELYFNGELDAIGTAKLVQHKKQCSICSNEFERQDSIKNNFKYLRNAEEPKEYQRDLNSKLLDSNPKKEVDRVAIFIKIAIPAFLVLIIAFGVVLTKLLNVMSESKKNAIITVDPAPNTSVAKPNGAPSLPADKTLNTPDSTKPPVNPMNNPSDVSQKPAATASVKSMSKWVQYYSIAKGNVCKVLKPKSYKIKDKISFIYFWKELFGKSKPVPKIDFTKDMVIAVAQGQQATGGYSIKVSSIIEKTDKVEVKATETIPNNKAAKKVNTSPYHIIKLKATNKPIEFIK